MSGASRDDRYRWSDRWRGSALVDDPGGRDAIDASNQSAGALIDLNGGATSLIGPGPARVRLAPGTVIEDADGTAFADIVRGNAADNRLRGLGGPDRIRGGGGDDGLDGGDGADTLTGGAGNDVLTGGEGADRFVFDAGSGFDRVLDFRHGVDRVAVVDAAALSDLRLTQAGSDVIVARGEARLRVLDSRLSDWSAQDFVFGPDRGAGPEVALSGPANGWAAGRPLAALGAAAILSAGGSPLAAPSGQKRAAVAGDAGGLFTVWEFGDVQFAPEDDFGDLAPGRSRESSAMVVFRDAAGVVRSATVTAVVRGVNENPTVLGPLTATAFENDRVEIDGLGGAADVDVGQTLRITHVHTSGGRTVALDGAAVFEGWWGDRYGRFAFEPDGRIVFDPRADFDYLRIGQSATPSVGFVIGDGAGGSVYRRLTVTVLGQFEKGPPLLSAALTARADGFAAGDVTRGEEGSAVVRVGGAALVDATAGNDRLAVDGSDGGRFTFFQYGGVQFSADGDFRGLALGETATTRVSYVVADAARATYAGEAVVTVVGVNDRPVTAARLTARTGENASVVVGGLAGATDVDGDDLRVAAVAGGRGDVRALGPEETRTVDSWSGEGAFTFRPGGEITFDPGADFDWLRPGQTRTASIGFFVGDPHGGRAYQTLTVTVRGEAEAPPVGALRLTARADASAAGDVVNREPGRVVASAAGVALVDATAGNDSLAVAGDAGGRFVFREFGGVQFFADRAFEDLGSGETSVTSVAYVVRDADGSTTPGVVSVTVAGVNANPTFVAAVERSGFVEGATAENTPLTLTPLTLASDVDGDALSIVSVSGRLSPGDDDGATLAIAPGRSATIRGWNGGTFEVHADGRVEFDPGRDFDRLNPGETATTELNFGVGDGHGGLNNKSLRVTVSGADEVYESRTDGVNAVTMSDGDVNGDNVEDWRQPIASAPSGGGLGPAEFFRVLRTEIAPVNTVRFVISPYSVDDPTAFGAYKTWIAAAARAGYTVDIVYADGVAISTTKIAQTDIDAAGVARIAARWQRIVDWVNATPEVEAKLGAYELINEPEVYRTPIPPSQGGGYYVAPGNAAAYAADIVALHGAVRGWGDKRIMVGGLAASSNFAVLTQGQMSDADPRAPIDAIRAAIGDRLVWSAHSYPNWGVGNESPADWERYWKNALHPIAGDQAVLTEGHARDVYANAVTNGDASLSFDNPYLRALDWFGRNGIGFSWWPATFEAGNPASQALLRPLADGSLLRFENNLFWARNAWQVDRGGRGDARAGDDRLAGGGEDDFLYGGAGSDQLVGLGGDDLLEGGEGDDLLSGGAGNDTLVGGAGRDNMTGGAGADLFVFRNDPGADGVADFRPGVDAISVVNVDFARLTFVRVGADTDVRLDGRTIVTLKSVAYTPNSADFDQIRFGRIVLDANGEETDVDDTLTGGAGDDRLHGGRGDDRLFGLAGADTLNGGEGSNRLTGGAGADLFMLGGHRREAGATLAQVTDFVDGVDRIGVATPNLRFADLRIARDGADARIATPDGEDVAIVLGAAGRIDASDFVFGL